MKNRVNGVGGHGWIVAIALAACLLAGCGGKGKEEEKDTLVKLPEKTTVKVQSVSHVSMLEVVSVSGTLEADKTAPLSFQVSGMIQHINVDEGDFVKQGELLATLDPRDYEDNLAIAEAALEQARDSYNRSTPLFREKVIAEQSYVEVKTSLAQAVARRDTARKALADTRLITPIAGIVGVKNIEVGQMVSSQVLAFSVVKTDIVYARVAVPESEIGQISIGLKAEVSVSAMNDRKFMGRVSMVGAVADEHSRTYPVKIELPNPDYVLRPGMIVQADIKTKTPMDVLTVPGCAIVQDADNVSYVFLADQSNGLALRRRIDYGRTFHDGIEIIHGLAPGDSVIVSGQHKLVDGSPIVITNADATAIN